MIRGAGRLTDEPNRLPPEERYLRDPAFHLLVDILENEMHRANYTPTELREAVILAAIRFEERRPPRPLYIYPADG